MDTTVSTTDRATERELQAECKRRHKVLDDTERELKAIRVALPALVAEHGRLLDGVREHETLVYQELKAIESPKQAYTFIEPIWRKENPRADRVLNEHEKLDRQARELQHEIDAKGNRAYALEQVELPHLRGWVEEADILLATYRTQLAEAVEREKKGETAPLTFSDMKRRILGDKS